MMPEILAEYFSALARLKAGSPERVEESVQISKDAVSLEAGRKKRDDKKIASNFSRPHSRDRYRSC